MIDIEKLQAEKSKCIEEMLEKVFPKSGLENLHDAVWYHMGTGGKRLRPLLAIMTCSALGGSERKVLPFAVACEVLHNWLLVHDDVEDGDKVRRNQPAVWVKYGLGHGINVGDYMTQKVFELILLSDVNESVKIRLMEKMVETSVRTAEGQAMDMNLRNNNGPSEEDYMKMVRGKTAYYLTVPMVGGAIIADREELIPKLVEFGMYAGPAFQIRDDILDLTEGKGRNEIGRDIKEGKRSILAIHCLKKCSSTEKKKLLEVLNKPVEETTEEDVFFAKGLFEKYGSIEYAESKAKELMAKAKKIAGEMPPELKEILIFFADYLIQRKK